MSVSFFGKTPDGRAIHLDAGAPEHLNLSNENARAFLLLLGVEPGRVAFGEMTLPEARRAIIFARSTFARRVGGFTRSTSDVKQPGKARIIEAGLGPDYLAQRLDAFERFLRCVSVMGATSVGWA
jgi:hypothetical protein